MQFMWLEHNEGKLAALMLLNERKIETPKLNVKKNRRVFTDIADKFGIDEIDTIRDLINSEEWEEEIDQIEDGSWVTTPDIVFTRVLTCQFVRRHGTARDVRAVLTCRFSTCRLSKCYKIRTKTGHISVET